MIPITIFLFIYLAFVVLIIVYGLFNLFHVVRHGHLDAALYFATISFILIFIVALFGSYLLLRKVDWSQKLNVTGAASFNQVPDTNF